MRRADGVHVGLLHHRHVLEHRFGVDGASVFGMSVLSVHALEEHALAVDVDEVATLGDVAEAILRREYHLLNTALVLLAHNHCVEVRILRAPWREIGETAEDGVDCACRGAAIADGSALHAAALGVEQLHENLLCGRSLVAVVHGELHVERSARCRVVERGCDVMVAHGYLGRGVEIHVAVNAGEVPHVLAFEIRAVAPAVDAN